MALPEIGFATRSQMLVHWKRASVNVIPGQGAVSARSAERIFAPTSLGAGQISLDPVSGSAIVALSIDAANKVISILERLEEKTRNAISDGATLSGNAQAEPFVTWKNSTVTSGKSRTTTSKYSYGDQSRAISVTSSYGLVNSGRVANAVDGNFESNISNGFSLKPVDVTGHWIQFDFGADNPQIVDEVTWHSAGTATSGVWRWEGSNDGVNFSAIGSSFTLGGKSVQVQGTLANNSIGYRYYRLKGESGIASAQPHQEVLFKSSPAPVVAASQASIANAQSLNTINNEIQRGLRSINSIISASTISGANILSSFSRTVALQTTKFGGRVDIDPRPLDTNALGLSGIKALNKSDAKVALGAISYAISNAKEKAAELQYIQNGIQSAKSSFSGKFAGGSSILPAGSLIDLLA
ncbi:MAG: hypothetical protein OEL50_01980 [Rhodospirillaceae bacterium]|nr:hypothetical protein [Rhodospirillaceae bacterium]